MALLPMNAEEVRVYVAAMWPEAMRSPLAQCVREVVASDEADRAIGFAKLQAGVPTVRDDAMEHARRCIETRGGWDVETLGHNIQSAFGDDLDDDECDDIAAAALAKFS